MHVMKQGKYEFQTLRKATDPRMHPQWGMLTQADRKRLIDLSNWKAFLPKEKVNKDCKKCAAWDSHANILNT